jgi:hypothetical protein
MRPIVGREGFDRPAASTSQIVWFETEWLATTTNLTRTLFVGDPARIARLGGPFLPAT